VHTAPVDLNSIVIIKASAQSFPQSKKLTICKGFDYPATKYSELCGGATDKPNSLEVTFGSDGLLYGDAPVSCLVGTWREQYDNPLSWRFNRNADGTLSITRFDGGVLGTFSKSGMDWIGELKVPDGTVWKSDVVLSPTADCKQVRTNQDWWYRR
jgi:hypothetical protein